MVDLSGLALHEQATYWIGASVRADTAMESTLIHIWDSVAGEGPAKALRPRDARSLIEGITKMLPTVRLPMPLANLLAELLSAANESRGKRHRMVHDWWATQNGLVVAMRPGTSDVSATRELSFFRDAILDSTTVRFRLMGVQRLVQAELHGSETIDRWEDERPIFEALRDGNFKPLDDGGVLLPDAIEGDLLEIPDGNPGSFGAF